MEAGINIASHYGQGSEGEGSHDPAAPLAPAALSVVGNTDRAGSLEVFSINDLQIDPNYQRELSNDLIEKIARDWDIAVAGPIAVSRRPNGSLWIIDGGHRTAAAVRAGETEIFARVFEGMSRQEEAEFRLKGNVRRSDKPYERFKAQLAAGREESLAIQEIASQFETRINPFPNAKEGINSVSAIEVLYRLDHGILLTRTFEAIQRAFGTVGGPTATVPVLKSFAFFLERHTDADRNRWLEKIGSAGVDDIHRKATSHRAIHGGAMWVNYYRAMVELYNDRLGAANKIELRLGKANQAFGVRTSDVTTQGGGEWNTGSGEDHI